MAVGDRIKCQGLVAVFRAGQLSIPQFLGPKQFAVCWYRDASGRWSCSRTSGPSINRAGSNEPGEQGNDRPTTCPFLDLFEIGRGSEVCWRAGNWNVEPGRGAGRNKECEENRTTAAHLFQMLQISAKAQERKVTVCKHRRKRIRNEIGTAQEAVRDASEGPVQVCGRRQLG